MVGLPQPCTSKVDEARQSFPPGEIILPQPCGRIGRFKDGRSMGYTGGADAGRQNGDARIAAPDGNIQAIQSIGHSQPDEIRRATSNISRRLRAEPANLHSTCPKSGSEFWRLNPGVVGPMSGFRPHSVMAIPAADVQFHPAPHSRVKHQITPSPEAPPPPSPSSPTSPSPPETF